MTASPKTFRDAAILLLREHGPMHVQALTEKAIERDYVTSVSAAPEESMRAAVTLDIKRHGAESPFRWEGAGVIALREGGTAPAADVAGGDDPEDILEDRERRVRIPLFMPYGDVRDLLRVWPGWAKSQHFALLSAIRDLRGTPQNNVDWSNPAEWIPERLSGDALELAQAIWERSAGRVNPRYTQGAWLLARKYGLIAEDATGALALTARGRDFVERPGGETEAYLDEQEGLLKLLSLVADLGPARTADITGDWASYLRRYSKYGRPSTVRGTLYRRINDLVDRGLVSKKAGVFSVTQAGIEYLARVAGDSGEVEPEKTELRSLARRQTESVRGALRDLLFEMDAYAFEFLVKRLLEEMEYRDVEVTSRSSDGGVDVVANIELGITSVREVVQVKRHRRAIQRKDLDALRGSLYRFNAVRGSIFTTSRFAKGCDKEAFAPGAPPITLVDGERLLELLVKHGIGVRRDSVELIELDYDSLLDVESEAAGEDG